MYIECLLTIFDCNGAKHNYFTEMVCWEREYILYAILGIIFLILNMLIVLFLISWYYEPFYVPKNYYSKSKTRLDFLIFLLETIYICKANFLKEVI